MSASRIAQGVPTTSRQCSAKSAADSADWNFQSARWQSTISKLGAYHSMASSTARRSSMPAGSADFSLKAISGSRRGCTLPRKRDGRAVAGGEDERRVVDVRPDRRGRAVFGPDVAVGEPDLAPERTLAPRAAQPQDLRRHGVSLVPVEAGVAGDDGGYRLAFVERSEKVLCYSFGIHFWCHFAQRKPIL